MNLSRHDLVWLKPSAWSFCQEFDSEKAGQLVASQLEIWKNQNWPCVVRRNEDPRDRTREDWISVGVPLWKNKTRVGFSVPLCEIENYRQPLLLEEIISAVPSQWQLKLHLLNQHTEISGLQFRVYGSVALQKCTGQTYLTPESDIDLLFRPATVEQLEKGVQLLASNSGTVPLDGEIEFPNGIFVAWKEWLSQGRKLQPQVLTKSLIEVQLRQRQDLLQSLNQIGKQNQINVG